TERRSSVRIARRRRPRSEARPIERAGDRSLLRRAGSGMNEEAILARARQLGIAVDWVDAMGRPQTVKTESLRRLLEALDVALEPPGVPPLITALRGKPIALSGIDGDASGELVLETGEVRSVAIRAGSMPGITRTGYHRLRLGDREITIAI